MVSRFGTTGKDSLLGTAADDWLYGKEGNDTISGGAGCDWIEGGSGADVVKLQPSQGWDKWLDFEDGIDKIDAGGLAFSDLHFSYDNVWKYVWVEDSSHSKLLGIKNISLSQLTADDFVNLGKGAATTATVGGTATTGTSGNGGGTTTPASTTDDSIAVRNGMKELWQDDWAGKLAHGDLDEKGFFDPYPGNYFWTASNAGEAPAQTKALVWTSEAWDRPDIGTHAAMALTSIKGGVGGYNSYTAGNSYFDTGYDIMSVAADFYFPTSYKGTSGSVPGANINTKGMFGLYAGADGTGKWGGTQLDPSVGFPPDEQNATWVDWYWKQKAVYGQDEYGNNNLRFGTGVTDLDRAVNGLDGKDDAVVNIPKGEWVHLEGLVQIDTNGHNGITQLYQNGVLISEVTGLDLGGATYGWKLHGFFGTWMWGGAGDQYVPEQTETYYMKNMSIYGGSFASAKGAIAPGSALAGPEPFDLVTAADRHDGLEVSQVATVTAETADHLSLVDVLGAAHPADALLIA